MQADGEVVAIHSSYYVAIKKIYIIICRFMVPYSTVTVPGYLVNITILWLCSENINVVTVLCHL